MNMKQLVNTSEAVAGAVKAESKAVRSLGSTIAKASGATGKRTETLADLGEWVGKEERRAYGFIMRQGQHSPKEAVKIATSSFTPEGSAMWQKLYSTGGNADDATDAVMAAGHKNFWNSDDIAERLQLSSNQRAMAKAGVDQASDTDEWLYRGTRRGPASVAETGGMHRSSNGLAGPGMDQDAIDWYEGTPNMALGGRREHGPFGSDGYTMYRVKKSDITERGWGMTDMSQPGEDLRHLRTYHNTEDKLPADLIQYMDRGGIYKPVIDTPKARHLSPVMTAPKHIQPSVPAAGPLTGKVGMMDENLHIEVLYSGDDIKGIAEAWKEQLFAGRASIFHNQGSMSADGNIGRLSGR